MKSDGCMACERCGSDSVRATPSAWSAINYRCDDCGRVGHITRDGGDREVRQGPLFETEVGP